MAQGLWCKMFRQPELNARCSCVQGDRDDRRLHRVGDLQRNCRRLRSERCRGRRWLRHGLCATRRSTGRLSRRLCCSVFRWLALGKLWKSPGSHGESAARSAPTRNLGPLWSHTHSLVPQATRHRLQAHKAVLTLPHGLCTALQGLLG